MEEKVSEFEYEPRPAVADKVKVNEVEDGYLTILVLCDGVVVPGCRVESRGGKYACRTNGNGVVRFKVDSRGLGSVQLLPFWLLY